MSWITFVNVLLILSSTGALDPTGHPWNWGPVCWNTKAPGCGCDTAQTPKLGCLGWVSLSWPSPLLSLRFCFHSQGTLIQGVSLKPSPESQAVQCVPCSVCCCPSQLWWQLAPGNEMHSLHPKQSSSNTIPTDHELHSTEFCPYASSCYR